MVEIHVPLALKLHAFGLRRLHDPEWCGEELWDNAKRHYRGRADSRDLFQKTIKNGFLFQLGRWIYEEYLKSEDFLESLDTEDLLWYLEDFRDMLIKAGVDPNDEILEAVAATARDAQGMWERDMDDFYEFVSIGKTRALLLDIHARILDKHESVVSSSQSDYAGNYADRVFHDRQLCAYIAELILDIGIDGTTDDEPPHQWCERIQIPEWAKAALRARERGRCANCGSNLVLELEDQVHVDHIVPLSKGGCNDLVNLQLLCRPCNTSKQNQNVSVTSSIPPYIRQHR